MEIFMDTMESSRNFGTKYDVKQWNCMAKVSLEGWRAV